MSLKNKYLVLLHLKVTDIYHKLSFFSYNQHFKVLDPFSFSDSL